MDRLIAALVSLFVAASPAPVVVRPGETAPAPAAVAMRVELTRLVPSSAKRRYAYPIRGCRSSYARSHHHYPAADIFARRGCAFVSPVAGTVDEVGRVNRWRPRTNRGADRGGLFVSVVGFDGVRYYGSHLRRLARGIKPGVAVGRGTRLGRVGTTGSAAGTASHLHFGVSWPTRPGVWWVRRGWVRPQRFLDSWRRGNHLSPRKAVRRAHTAAGRDVPRCRRYC